MAVRLVSRELLHDCCEPILNTDACGGHDEAFDAAYILGAEGDTLGGVIAGPHHQKMLRHRLRHGERRRGQRAAGSGSDCP